MIPETFADKRTKVSAPVALIWPAIPKVTFQIRLTIAALESVDKSCSRTTDSAAQGNTSALKLALMPDLNSFTCREKVSAQVVFGSAIKLTL